MILNILMDITDLLSSKVYKSFDEQYKGSKKYMAHTLVVYIFIIFAVFVKDAKIPKVIQEFKCTNLIKFKHFRMILIMKGNLMKQLILCIVTCSPNIVFHITPLTLKSFCPDLVKEIGRIADNVVDKKRALDKVNGSGNNQSTTTTINTRITSITTIIIVMGTVIIVITMEIIAKLAL